MEIKEEIRKAIRRETGLSASFIIRSTSRQREFVIIRSILMHILREEGHTFKKIGKMFKRDHSTIIHGCNSFDMWVQLPKQYKEENRLIKLLLDPDRKQKTNSMSNLLTFHRTIMDKGEALYNMETQEFNPTSGFFVGLGIRQAKKLSDYSFEDIFEPSSIIVKHMRLLEDDSVFLRGRIIEDSIELDIVQECPVFKDAVDVALEHRIRTIYDASTGLEVSI